MTTPGGSKLPQDQSVDLDQFLQVGGAGAASPTSAPSVAMPEADRMAIVGIFVDDSGSMDDLRDAVLEGLKMSVTAFRGAKGSDFFLMVNGFKGELFNGMLKDVMEDSFSCYSPTYGETPLVSHAASLAQKLRARASQYLALGIPTTIALLIITDGLPNSDSLSPEEFPQHAQGLDYVVGMGVAESGNDEAIMKFKKLFKDMGVAKTVTPTSNPAEVRHAINQFSQSVASIAAV